MTTRQHADAQVMQQIAGVYYGERNPSPDGSMFNQAYRKYDANGRLSVSRPDLHR